MAPAPQPQYKVGDKFIFDILSVKDIQEITAVNDRSITIKSSVLGTITQSIDFSNPESWTGDLTQAFTTKLECFKF